MDHQRKTPPRPTASRSELMELKRRRNSSDSLPIRNSSCLMVSTTHSLKASVREAQPRMRIGTTRSLPTGRSIQILLPRLTRWNPAHCPPTGKPPSPSSPPTPRDSRVASRPARSSMPLQPQSRGSSAVQQTSPRRPRLISPSRALATSSPMTVVVAISTSACANTQQQRSAMASRCRRSVRTGLDSSSSPTTRAAQFGSLR